MTSQVQTPRLLVAILCLKMASAAIVEEFQSDRGTLSRLLLDGNDVLVGGNNLILKFRNSKLSAETLEHTRRLPCGSDRPGKYACTGSEMAIFMQYHTGNKDFLLTCTAEDVGVCFLLNSENLDILSDGLLPNGSSDPHIAYIGSKTSAVALQVPGRDFIYSAISAFGMTSQDDVFTFSERWIKHELPSRYVMNYKYSNGNAYIKSNPSTQFQLVNGFLSAQYVHFLWNHISHYEKKARINQVCINDLRFRSYIETDLQCGRYDVLVSAATLNVSGTLFLVTSFSSPENRGTALCLFKAEDIDRHFNEERRKCFLGGHGSWPNWIAGRSQNVCQTQVVKTVIDCGQSSNNTRISASKGIKQDPFYQTSTNESAMTSLTFYQHDAKNAVGFIGHSNGTVSKMLLNTVSGTHHLLYSVNVTPNGEPLGKDLVLSANKEKLFFTHQNTVASLRVDDCGLLATCHQCLADVTSCMWDGICVALKNDTENMPNTYTKFCPQNVQVTPLAGPLEGGTEVIVKGVMGRPGSHLTVELGNMTFTTTIVNEGNGVRFNTSSSPEEQNVNITVSVTAPSDVNASTEIWDVSTHGTVVNTKPFMFKKVEMFVDDVQKAKLSGNVTLCLLGKNLNIGSRRRIQIGTHLCSNAQYGYGLIECRSPVRNETGRIRVRYHMDNAVRTGPEIEFVKDPIVRAIQPAIVIRTGGIPIVFKGDNLGGLGHDVNLVYSLAGHPGNIKALKGICLHHGDALHCQAPDVSSTYSARQIENATLNVTLTFTNIYGPIKGVNFADAPNIVTIVPDPVLDNICRLDGQENGLMDVTFTGQHLSNVDDTQIHILTGSQTCNITELLDDRVKCKMASNTDPGWTPKFKVHVGEMLNTVTITCPMLKVLQPLPSRKHEGSDSTIVIITLSLLGLMVLSVVTCAVYRGVRRLRRKIDLPYNVYFRRDQGTLSMEDMTQRDEPSHNVYQMDTSEHRRSSVDAFETWGGVDMETRQFLETSRLLVPKEHLTLAELIGQGNFGCVYKGYMRSPDEKEETVVAVKTLHRSNPKDMDVDKFLTEALIMKDFHHRNVMALVGICVGVEKLPLVVLPYLRRGDLLTYVRDVNNVPTVKKLVEFGIDVAAGMNYLCGLKFVHRDLAARNCMIDDDLTVKVADFGLSRDIYEKEYYSSCNKKTMLPVKWMSPESLELGLFNYKTDLWSYGVVLWELLTRGMHPYPTVDNWDLLRYLKDGRRLEKPDYCPEGMYRIMASCWRWEPDERPTFEELVVEIPELLRSLASGQSKVKENQLEISDGIL